MALMTLDGGAADLIHRSYPETKEAGEDTQKLSTAAFPSIEYTSDEKVEIEKWLLTHLNLSSQVDDPSRSTTALSDLNTHLSTRTTILGSKPSVADAVLYARLAPVVKSWTPEQKTGAEGHHHVVRYLDFVQNAPLFGLKLDSADKIDINPDEILAPVKTFDAKADKEKKKREKVALLAAEGEKAGGNDGAVNQNGTSTIPSSDATSSDKPLAEKAKDAVSQTAAAAASVIPGMKTEKKEKKPKAPKAPAAPVVEKPLSPSLIDLRVGHILKATTHPNADSLFVSTIACGDPPGTENTSEYEGQVVRTVCSGLNGLIPLEAMQNRKIIAVCNLKPVTMRGVKSAAMVLAASLRIAPGETDNHAGPVELVDPPAEAKAGERVWFEGFEGEPEGVLNPKKKVWEMCQVGFTTTEGREVAFQPSEVESLKDAGKATGKLLVKGGGYCTVPSLTGATVR